MEFHAIKITTHEISPYREILGSSIDPVKKEKIDSLLFQADRDRALIGAILSRTVLCNKLGIGKDELFIDTSPYGKPYVRGARDFDFNISHSGCWIVCGAGRGRLGVDVEKIDEADAGFAKRYFTPHEAELLRTSKAATRRRLFYSIWTLKESYIKALGKGLAMPLDGFSMRFQPHGITAVSEGRDTGFNFRLFQNMDPEYSFALCSDNPLPEKTCVWNLEKLMRNSIQLC